MDRVPSLSPRPWVQPFRLPPPRRRIREHVYSSRFPRIPAFLFPVDTHPVLECIAAKIKVFIVDRRAVSAVGDAFDPQHRTALLYLQRSAYFVVGENRVDRYIGVTERESAVVLKDQKDVAGDEVGIGQTLFERLGYVGDFQRNGRTVEQPHSMDFYDARALGNIQAACDVAVRLDYPERAQLVDDFISHR